MIAVLEVDERTAYAAATIRPRKPPPPPSRPRRIGAEHLGGALVVRSRANRGDALGSGAPPRAGRRAPLRETVTMDLFTSLVALVAFK